MTRLSPRAERQLDNFPASYAAKFRPEAVRNLLAAVQRATARITETPSAGLPALRPCLRSVVKGCLWLKQGRYWSIYTDMPDPVLLGIYHDTANIPGRL